MDNIFFKYHIIEIAKIIKKKKYIVTRKIPISNKLVILEMKLINFSKENEKQKRRLHKAKLKLMHMPIHSR